MANRIIIFAGVKHLYKKTGMGVLAVNETSKNIYLTLEDVCPSEYYEVCYGFKVCLFKQNKVILTYGKTYTIQIEVVNVSDKEKIDVNRLLDAVVIPVCDSDRIRQFLKNKKDESKD